MAGSETTPLVSTSWIFSQLDEQDANGSFGRGGDVREVGALRVPAGNAAR